MALVGSAYLLFKNDIKKVAKTHFMWNRSILSSSSFNLFW